MARVKINSVTNIQPLISFPKVSRISGLSIKKANIDFLCHRGEWPRKFLNAAR